jgi:hypothetical protein
MITPMLKLVRIKIPSWEGARQPVKWQGWVRGGQCVTDAVWCAVVCLNRNLKN